MAVPVVLIVVPQPSDTLALHLAIAGGADDAREDGAGVVRTREKSLPIGGGNLVALRFAGVSIPQGAVIGSAVLGLVAANRSTLNEPLAVRYLGEASDDSAPLTESPNSLSARDTTAASVLDSPPEWVLDQPNASPDLASIIQEIVARPDWVSGNALTVFLDDAGSGVKRIAGSRNDRVSRAATLTVHYWRP